jgi:hypothetical protein
VNWKKLRAWIPAFVILEIGATVMSLAYMGKRSANTPGEGNKIARMVLDDPTDLESFVFYFILAHVLIGFFLFIGWVSANRKNKT